MGRPTAPKADKMDTKRTYTFRCDFSDAYGNPLEDCDEEFTVEVTDGLGPLGMGAHKACYDKAMPLLGDDRVSFAWTLIGMDDVLAFCDMRIDQEATDHTSPKWKGFHFFDNRCEEEETTWGLLDTSMHEFTIRTAERLGMPVDSVTLEEMATAIDAIATRKQLHVITVYDMLAEFETSAADLAGLLS